MLPVSLAHHNYRRLFYDSICGNSFFRKNTPALISRIFYLQQYIKHNIKFEIKKAKLQFLKKRK